MEIIRNREIVQDAWQHVADGEPVPEGVDATVSLQRFVSEREALADREGRLGVRIAPADELDALVPHLGELALVAVEFPKFTDGRGYSKARLLRERHAYTGELRAIGYVLRDQLFYMHRCGIESFELAPGKSLTEALGAFEEFTVTYQPTGTRT